MKFNKIKDLFAMMSKATAELEEEVEEELKIPDPDPEKAKAILNSVEIKEDG